MPNRALEWDGRPSWDRSGAYADPQSRDTSFLCCVSQILSNQSVINRYLERVLAARVAAYSQASASLQYVPINQIQPLPRFASNDRLVRARALLDCHQASSVSLFDLAVYRRPGETYFRLSLPPVVEKHEGSYVLIDGLHRVLSAHRLNYSNVQLIVLDNIDLPLPSSPIQWSSVRPLSTDLVRSFPRATPQWLSRAVKFRHYKGEFFRPLGSFLSGSAFLFDSLKAIAAHMHEVVRCNAADLHSHFAVQPDLLDERPQADV